MQYDTTQLNKDLSKIVSKLGTRQQKGFFTEGVYEDSFIKIVDRYTDPEGPSIYTKQGKLYFCVKKDFDTMSSIGQHILELVIKLE